MVDSNKKIITELANFVKSQIKFNESINLSVSINNKDIVKFDDELIKLQGDIRVLNRKLDNRINILDKVDSILKKYNVKIEKLQKRVSLLERKIKLE